MRREFQASLGGTGIMKLYYYITGNHGFLPDLLRSTGVNKKRFAFYLPLQKDIGNRPVGHYIKIKLTFKIISLRKQHCSAVSKK